jgi:RND family efflux transporter MFP subunit
MITCQTCSHLLAGASNYIKKRIKGMQMKILKLSMASCLIVLSNSLAIADSPSELPAWVKKPTQVMQRSEEVAVANSQNRTGKYDCLIEPSSVSDVSTREEGVLDELLVNRGDIVKKGQPIAQLESGLEKIAASLADIRAKMSGDLQSKRAAVDFNKRQLKRVNDLYKKKTISYVEKDKAETELMLARMELLEASDRVKLSKVEKERADHILERRTIKSPLDGVIVKTLLDPGENVEDRPIMTIATVNPLNVEVILPAEKFGEIKVGMDATVTPLIHNFKDQNAKVAIVDRVIDAASNTFGVRLELPNPEYKVPGGIRCDVNFKK